jgi:hypothetical protein
VKLAQKLLGIRSILFTTWKVRTSRLAHPLFSYSYELLFPQLLCFDNHLSCPAVYYPSVHCGSDLSALSVRVFPLWLTTYFQQLAASFFSLCRFFATSPLCFQELPASSPKMPGYGIRRFCLENTRVEVFAFPANLLALRVSALSFGFHGRSASHSHFRLSTVDCRLPSPQC